MRNSNRFRHIISKRATHCQSLHILYYIIITLIWQPDSLRTYMIPMFISVAMDFTSSFYDSFSFFFKARFMILRKMNDFPISFIDCIDDVLLCLARIALESPTFAHVNFLVLSSKTVIIVDPLVCALNSSTSNN